MIFVTKKTENHEILRKWCFLWRKLVKLGADLGLTWADLGLTWAGLVLTWADLGLTWADLGLTWADLVLTWADLGWLGADLGWLGLTWADLGLTGGWVGLTWGWFGLTWSKHDHPNHITIILIKALLAIMRLGGVRPTMKYILNTATTAQSNGLAQPTNKNRASPCMLNICRSRQKASSRPNSDLDSSCTTHASCAHVQIYQPS